MRTYYSLLCFVLIAGCSYYSVSGSLPSHIKTCAVPLFENETVEPGIVENLTDAISGAIINDGNMKVVGEFQADAVVRGTIIDVIDEAEAYSNETSAEEFRIRIIAQVEFFDRVKNQPLWEEARIEGESTYAAGDITARDTAIEEALDMLAREIIDKTVAGW